ncbi:MAG: L,D-transpeptidase family protein [Pseudomonadota bacterium]
MTKTVFVATASGRFIAGDHDFFCTIGRAGVIAAAEKREGDGASPIGSWRMKRVFYRADRLDRPATGLPVTPLHPNDGWCDAPDHPLYNRPVTLPFPASHEQLWRDDHAYDVIVELAHNDAPVVPGLGSAIFLHLAHDDERATAGCVALSAETMLTVLKQASEDSYLEIRR